MRVGTKQAMQTLAVAVRQRLSWRKRLRRNLRATPPVSRTKAVKLGSYNRGTVFWWCHAISVSVVPSVPSSRFPEACSPALDQASARIVNLYCRADCQRGARARLRAGGGPAQPAVARRAHRLPPESAAARLHGRPRADRRIRRRTAQHRAHPGRSRLPEEGGARHRGLRASTITAASTSSAFCAPASATLTNGHASQGASTITMQVARNFFLSSEKTYTRKIYEMLLAYKIERALTKDQILEVYMNQIYLGQRAYGFASGRAGVFRQGPEGHHARRGRHARRPAEGAVGVQPGRQSEAREDSPAIHPASACSNCTTSRRSSTTRRSQATARA